MACNKTNSISMVLVILFVISAHTFASEGYSHSEKLQQIVDPSYSPYNHSHSISDSEIEGLVCIVSATTAAYLIVFLVGH